MARNQYKTIPVITPDRREAIFSQISRCEIDKCWPWLGYKNDRNYGIVKFSGGLFRATRIIYFMETGVDPGQFMVCHSCDNPPCCNPKHLFLGTGKQNSQDASQKGLYTRGEKQWRSVLTDELVVQIRALNKNEGIGYRRISKRLNVSYQAVQGVLYGITWKHIQS